MAGARKEATLAERWAIASQKAERLAAKSGADPLRLELVEPLPRDFNYEAYLRTPEWKAKSRLVIERAGGVCEGCGIERATQTHHLTYTHVGNEFLWELRAVCRGCHERWHGRNG